MNPIPLSFEVKTMSSIFPSPGPGQRNQCIPLFSPTYSPGWPWYLSQGEANDLCRTRDSNSIDKREGDDALILPPSLNQCSVLRVFKAAQKGEKLKQGRDATEDRTRDFSHRRSGTNQLYHPCYNLDPGRFSLASALGPTRLSLLLLKGECGNHRQHASCLCQLKHI